MIERDDLGKQSNKCYESTLDCQFLKILKKTKEYDMPAKIWTALAILACLSLPAFAQVQQKPVNGLLAGTFHTERPTLLSLGFSWKISGDDNRNATVAVTYRRVGEKAWIQGLPLFRMGGELIAGPKPMFGGLNYYDYRVPPAFAGSVLNLQPDTAYCPAPFEMVLPEVWF